jgi:hypothetical protein
VRRGLTILLLLALVFAAAAVVGFWTAARLAPERLRLVAERQLGRVLKGQVALASLEVARAREFPWLWLEARGARAVLKDDVTLLAGRVRARLDPLSLALGRLGVADLRLDDVIVLFPPRPDEHPEQGRVAKIQKPIRVAGEFLRKRPCGIPDLEVRGLSVLVPRRGMLDVLLEQGEGSLSCKGLGRDRAEAHLAALARRDTETFPARFAFAMNHELAAVDIELDEVPLAPLLGILRIDEPLAGTLSGTAKLEAPAQGAQRLSARLTGRAVKGPLPGGEKKPWLELDLAAPRLTGTLSATPGRLRLEAAELRDGGLTLRAEGEMGLPERRTAPGRLSVALDELPLGEAARIVAQLPPGPREDAARALDRVSAGRLHSLHAEAEGPLGVIGDAFSGGLLSQPGALRLEAALAGATVRLGESDQATGVDARFEFAGDRLALEVGAGTFHARPLPLLSLELTGIANVRSFEEFNCREPRPQAPLAGLPRLQEWLAEERSDPEEQATLDWQRVRLELDWVSHPALLCGLEQVAGLLEPTPDGLRFEVPRGVWAGLPIEMSGRWHRAPEDPANPGAVELAAKLGPPFEAMSLDPPASPWLSGRFAVEATRMGRWHVRGARGQVAAHGARLEFPGTVLQLGPGAEVEGRIAIDLGVAGSVPYSAEAQFAAVDLLSLWKAADFERGTLAGTLHGAAAIAGQLQPRLNPLGDATGLVAMHARNGTVNRKIPVMVAIALASERFNPFGARDELPYDAIDAVARVKKGKLVFDSVQLHAPTLRMGATGKGGVVEPYQLEGVLGMFFFPGLDSLIDRVPILNRVILGRNGNLVGAYFAITGEWGEPEASLIPIQSIATGPAGFLTEGLPGFVMGGIKRIQSLVLPDEAAAPRADVGRADS